MLEQTERNTKVSQISGNKNENEKNSERQQGEMWEEAGVTAGDEGKGVKGRGPAGQWHSNDHKAKRRQESNTNGSKKSHVTAHAGHGRSDGPKPQHEHDVLTM